MPKLAYRPIRSMFMLKPAGTMIKNTAYTKFYNEIFIIEEIHLDEGYYLASGMLSKNAEKLKFDIDFVDNNLQRGSPGG